MKSPEYKIVVENLEMDIEVKGQERVLSSTSPALSFITLTNVLMLCHY